MISVRKSLRLKYDGEIPSSDLPDFSIAARWRYENCDTSNSEVKEDYRAVESANVTLFDEIFAFDFTKPRSSLSIAINRAISGYIWMRHEFPTEFKELLEFEELVGMTLFYLGTEHFASTFGFTTAPWKRLMPCGENGTKWNDDEQRVYDRVFRMTLDRLLRFLLEGRTYVSYQPAMKSFDAQIVYD